MAPKITSDRETVSGETYTQSLFEEIVDGAASGSASKTAPLYCNKYGHKHTTGTVGDNCTKKIKSKNSRHYVECFGKLVTDDEATTS